MEKENNLKRKAAKVIRGLENVTLRKRVERRKRFNLKKRGLKEKNMVEIIGFVSVSKRKGIVCSLQT